MARDPRIEGPIVDPGSTPRTERILRTLPDWFGIESSLLEYAEQAATLPAFFAHDGDHDGDEVTGVLTLLQHSAEAAEIHVVGVDPRWHGDGHGRALLSSAQHWLAQKQTRFLQVKTVGPSSDDAAYARTRVWYERQGFVHLEEIKTLWNEQNPCLIMIKNIGGGVER